MFTPLVQTFQLILTIGCLDENYNTNCFLFPYTSSSISNEHITTNFVHFALIFDSDIIC